MKSLRGGLIAGVSLASLILGSTSAFAAALPSAGAPDGTPQLLTDLQFSSASAIIPSVPGWSFGAQNGGSVGVVSTPGPTGAMVDALEGSYPEPALTAGSNFVWANYSLANLNTEDVYIDFWAKMPGPQEGFKFVKIFGQRPPLLGYADTTFAANYTGGDYGAIYQVSFGDGTTLINDSQNAINLDGENLAWMGRSYGTAVVQTPQMSAFSSADWGTGWHHFLIHVKFNSGTTAQNQTPNGEVFLEIDGKVYVNATGLYNRNPANAPIDFIQFFGWAQKDPQPFQVYYDDIRISTGGFVSQILPAAPSNVAVQ